MFHRWLNRGYRYTYPCSKVRAKTYQISSFRSNYALCVICSYTLVCDYASCVKCSYTLVCDYALSDYVFC